MGTMSHRRRTWKLLAGGKHHAVSTEAVSESVNWSALYGNRDFVAQGRVLEVDIYGWKLEGPMPVRPGMLLHVSMWRPHEAGGFEATTTRVLWAKGHQFFVTKDALSGAVTDTLKPVA